MIEFHLNGQPQTLESADPNLSILEWLRTKMRLTGTKEGCASGDCGACTVMLGTPSEQDGLSYQSVNSCIALIGSLHGKHLVTIDALQSEPAHPVQTAMVECHGSQCGFCTPGIIMSLVALHHEAATQPDCDRHRVLEALSGNLCRCTGYRPIMDAATRSIVNGVQEWDGGGLLETAVPSVKDTSAASLQDAHGKRFDAPVTLEQLRDLLAGSPDARLVAGSTDLALEITQQLKTLPHLVSTEQVPELQRIDVTDEGVCIGAAVSYRRAGSVLNDRWPAFGPMLERLGSLQIRNRGTLGGNIGNASPIADMPPPLIALGAQIQLDSVEGTRWLPLEDFFLDYRKTALRAGEFIRTVRVPEPRSDASTSAERLFIYKVSKRLDDDISAVLGAFWFQFDGEQISDCRLAYGGMAATPKRARSAEAALRGATFDDASISKAIAALASDFSPMSDVRASAAYRAQVAGNLLRRALLEYSAGADSDDRLMVTDYA